jgi:hypothetical protein
MSTIYDYYESQLNATCKDVSLRDLPVESVCGQDCKGVIDATKTYLDYFELAHGLEASITERQHMVRKCNHVISIFWRG